jgi:hypothetical protein
VGSSHNGNKKVTAPFHPHSTAQTLTRISSARQLALALALVFVDVQDERTGLSYQITIRQRRELVAHLPTARSRTRQKATGKEYLLHETLTTLY